MDYHVKYFKYKKKYLNFKGGVFITEGTVGCIFNPDLKNNNPGIISKVYLIDRLNNELTILNQIKKIDPCGNFHCLLIEHFNFNILNISDITTELNKCSLFKSITDYDNYDNYDNYYVLNLYNGGMKLNDFITINKNNHKSMLNLNQT